jgi:hypothetical protein
MKRLHWSTLAGAAVLGAVALLTLGPVTVAVLMLRCCSDSTGPGWGAWSLLLGLLALLVAVAAAAGGVVGSLIRRAVLRIRRNP